MHRYQALKLRLQWIVPGRRLSLAAQRQPEGLRVVLGHHVCRVGCSATIGAPISRGTGQAWVCHKNPFVSILTRPGSSSRKLCELTWDGRGLTSEPIIISARGNRSKGRSSSGRHCWCTHQVVGSITEFHILETDPVEVYSAIPFPTGVFQFH